MKISDLIYVLSDAKQDLEVYGYYPVEVDAARFTVELLPMHEDDFIVRGDKLIIEFPQID